MKLSEPDFQKSRPQEGFECCRQGTEPFRVTALSEGECHQDSDSSLPMSVSARITSSPPTIHLHVGPTTLFCSSKDNIENTDFFISKI